MVNNLINPSKISIVSVIIISIYLLIVRGLAKRNKDPVSVALRSIESQFKKIERMLDTDLAEKAILTTMFNKSVSLLNQIYYSPVPNYRPTVEQYRKCKELEEWSSVLSEDIEHFSFVS